MQGLVVPHLFTSQVCLHPEVVSLQLRIHSQLTQLWFDAVAQILVSSFILDAVVYPAWLQLLLQTVLGSSNFHGRSASPLHVSQIP